MEGTQAMIDLSQRATQDDLCLFLLSGGASALLVAPRAGITLQDKQQLSRILPAAGANIAELNSVRTCLSQVKGGGLARICQAGRLLTLILSDVLGDPLQVIGSAPTVSVDPSATEALEILVRYGVTDQLPNVVAWLRRAANQQRRSKSTPSVESSSTGIEHCVVVGNLSMAMNAAADLARDLGYQTMILPIDTSSPTAEQEGDHLAERLAELAQLETPQCIISGGEPVVRLAPECRRGTGGRNQQLVLSAGCWLQRHAAHLADRRKKRNWIIFSAGTDGEDGPTDAAGARYDATVADRQGQKNLDATDFLQRNDAYPFFDQVDGLVRTGPTGTNVGDLRVALWHP
jgi:hydroxypyruvate reductase